MIGNDRDTPRSASSIDEETIYQRINVLIILSYLLAIIPVLSRKLGGIFHGHPGGKRERCQATMENVYVATNRPGLNEAHTPHLTVLIFHIRRELNMKMWTVPLLREAGRAVAPTQSIIDYANGSFVGSECTLQRLACHHASIEHGICRARRTSRN